MTVDFDVAGPGPVLLSLPAWTPGAYEINNFARWISGLRGHRRRPSPSPGTSSTTTPGGCSPAGAKAITVRFDYRADTLDNAMAWSRPDFAFFNGTNLLPYPEGRGFDFPATVTVKTQPGWQVATGMAAAPAPGQLTARATTTTWWTCRSSSGGWTSTASRWREVASASPPTRPARMAGPARALLWDQIGKMMPPMSAVFQETPWHSYTTLMVFTPELGGGSALEHQNSHLGLYNPGLHRQPAARLDHGPRDLPRLEREAAAAGRHVALPLRPSRSRPPGSG